MAHPYGCVWPTRMGTYGRLICVSDALALLKLEERRAPAIRRRNGEEHHLLLRSFTEPSGGETERLKLAILGLHDKKR